MVFKKGWNKEKKESKSEVKVEAPVTPVVVESPKYPSFYIERDKGIWKLHIVELQDEKVVSRKTFECENKAHALEKFKIKFATLYFLGK